jgi:hypothetical protein
MSLNPIKADAVHFGSVLSETMFEIPELQRPYSWLERQTEDFVNDVVKLLIVVRGTGDGADGYPGEHLFGTIVVLTPANLGERASVIDGQQRLTTVSVTLGLLENEMRRLAEQVEGAGGPQAAAVVARLEDGARKIHERLWRQGVDVNKPETLRLLTSPEIRETYQAILKGEQLRHLPSESAQAPAVRLVDAATIIQDELIQHPEFYDGRDFVEKQRHLIWLMNAILDQLLFVLISTPSNSAAYELFEVLNARGEPLNTLDLLKTWIMATMADDPRRNAVYGKLRNLVEDPDNQLDFLDDFYRARVFRSLGEYDPIPNVLDCRKYLFSEPDNFRHVTKPDPATFKAVCDKIVEQVDLMSAWLPKWKLLTEAIWPFETLSQTGQESLVSLLDVLGCKIARPLLLQAAANLSADDFESLLHMVEKTFFRYKTVCSKPAGPLEKVFYDIITIIDTNKTIDLEVVANKLQELLDQNASDSTFAANLDEFVYQSGARAKRIKYFLWLLDRYAAMPAPAPMALKLEEFQIEHVAPQNPANGLPAIRSVDALGNLCVLTAEENRKLRNKDFVEKLQIVNGWKAEDCFITAKLSRKIFEDHTKWGEDEVLGRTKALKHQACKVFRVAEAE